MIASYTIQSNDTLAGVIVRGWACGRYLNNSGGVLAPVATTTLNGATLLSLSLPQVSLAAASAWSIQVHFYFTNPVTNAGNAIAVGSCIAAQFAGPQGTSTTTGGPVTTDALLMQANPYTTLLGFGQQFALGFALTAAGGDSLEVHASYLEAL